MTIMGIGLDISQFGEELMQLILGTIYDGLYDKCESLFRFLFFYLDNRVIWAQGELGKQIDTWNGSAFALIQDIVVKDICIPIAAAFITFIFCMELVHLMQDSNQMNNIKPQNVVFIFLKFAVCAIICSKSFEIVMGFFELGSDAIGTLGGRTAGKLTGMLELSDILPTEPDTYTFGLVITILGDFLLILLSLLVICTLSVIMYVRIMLWFLEFLIYAAAAPIPFSTFSNKEWSQVGMNYTRKMLALSFEGFFMFLMLILYGYIAAGLKPADLGGGSGGWLTSMLLTSANFAETLMMLVGTGIAITMLMCRAGSISASIFNAH